MSAPFNDQRKFKCFVLIVGDSPRKSLLLIL